MRAKQHGFTIVELMVVVVIVGVLAGLAGPRFTRDRIVQDGAEFANELVRELQRTRMEAMSSRMPMYAFVFSDRVEIRTATPGATPIAAVVPPTSSSPILRKISAKARITVYDVSSSTSTPSATLTTTTPKTLIFTTLGEGYIGPTKPTTPAPVYLHLDNAAAPASSLERHYRIDVAALTGFVQMVEGW
jgi:prepilin-type N-terminal cleavage/methylation domain-containing protein